MIDREALRGPLGVSLFCGAGLVVLALWLVIPFLASLGALGGGAAPSDATYSQLLATHDQAHRTDLNRVHGRSFFFEPPAPPKPKPPEPTGACCVGQECTVMRRDACLDRGGRFQGKDTTCGPETCKPREAPKPADVPKVDPRPKRYGGPDIIAIYGSDVIFRADKGLMVIPVGRMMDEIEVVSVQAPHHAELMWKEGGPFTVSLFDEAEDPWEDGPLKDVIELPTASTTRTVDEARPRRTAPE
ncbi:MAG: hypothetical protein QF733_02865 [Phycisphaerales bacterium]|jgi:hypothetical protein|nr:hypothetical protein [Phycisphaerales bacterium]